MLGGGLLSGAELGCAGRLVVEVHPVGEVGEAEPQACRFHLGKQLVLAVEAALGVVADVIGLVELSGLQDVGGNAVLRGEGQSGGKFLARQRGGIGDDRQHTAAERLVRSIGKVRGIGAAGVGDKQRSKVSQRLIQKRGFFRKVHCVVLRMRVRAFSMSSQRRNQLA